MTTTQKKRLENVKEKSDIDKHTKEQLENVKDTSDVDKHTKEQYEKVNDSSDVEKHTKEQLENDQCEINAISVYVCHQGQGVHSSRC